MYKTPYPSAYDQFPLPHNYKLPDFTKFFRQGEVSIVEHVNRSIMQCGEATQNDTECASVFHVSVRISLYVVYHASSQFYIILGRSEEAVSLVLLLWHVRDEVDRSDQSKAEER